MNKLKLYIPQCTPPIRFAAASLRQMGYCVTEEPDSSITHVLLPIPTDALPASDALPDSVTMIGGNLPQSDRRTIDLLCDEQYLAENAAITAHCAVKVAMRELPCTLMQCNVLVIGWGRIGRSLAPLLHHMGACVSVASRDEARRAMLAACGYRTEVPGRIDPRGYRVIFNTAPAPVLDGDGADPCCVLIDLASVRGISGERVIWARGLPGKEAPESAGALIARTVARQLGKE